MALLDIMRREPSEPVVSRQSWDPFLTLHNEINRLFSEAWGGRHGLLRAHNDINPFAAQMDVMEDDKQIKVTMDLPGMEAKDVELMLEGQSLTIKGEKKEEYEEKEGNYLVRERACGAFQRCIMLPEEVDADKAAASFKHGVLCVTIPKHALPKAKTKKLTIKEET